MLRRNLLNLHIIVYLRFRDLPLVRACVCVCVRVCVCGGGGVFPQSAEVSHCFKANLAITWQKKKQPKTVKVARDSCDITHSLKQASIHTSHVHASKSCTKYSLHLVQSTSTHYM